MDDIAKRIKPNIRRHISRRLELRLDRSIIGMFGGVSMSIFVVVEVESSPGHCTRKSVILPSLWQNNITRTLEDGTINKTSKITREV